MKIFSGRAAETRVRKIAARSSQLDAVEVPVRRIVSDVKLNGDAALRKYSQRWDDLGKQPFRIPERDLNRAWVSAEPKLKSALSAGSSQHPAILSMAKAEGMAAPK